MAQMARGGDSLDSEALRRLQQIIGTLTNEKMMLENRLTKANKDRFNSTPSADPNAGLDEDFKRENYIFMEKPGLVFSTCALAARLRQPPRPPDKPIPFSTVYVCDFELDFVSRGDTDVLTKPMQQLKAKNDELSRDLDSVVKEVERLQESEFSQLQQVEQTR